MCAPSPRPTSSSGSQPRGLTRRTHDAVLLDDPSMGPVWVASIEDLLLAKLEWSDGDLSGLQGKDAHAITAMPGTLDRAYLRRHAASLGNRRTPRTGARRCVTSRGSDSRRWGRSRSRGSVQRDGRSNAGSPCSGCGRRWTACRSPTRASGSGSCAGRCGRRSRLSRSRRWSSGRPRLMRRELAVAASISPRGRRRSDGSGIDACRSAGAGCGTGRRIAVGQHDRTEAKGDTHGQGQDWRHGVARWVHRRSERHRVRQAVQVVRRR